MNILVKIVLIILTFISCITIINALHEKADYSVKDPFNIGYWAGYIVALIITVIVFIIFNF